MIRIAMVEDEEEYAKTIRRYCSRYSTEKHTDIDLVWHDNPVAFLEGYRGDYDVVFMDVVMPLMDGMTCARGLRERDGNVLLCFITSMAQYAIHGYEVGALDYVVKPIAYEEFALKMDRLGRLLERQGARTFLINSRSAVHRIDLRDLYYVEVYSHSLLFHTAQGDYEAYGKLSALAEDERFQRFLRVTPSHLVNSAYISAVSEDTLTVHGVEIPISRRRKKECLEKLAMAMGGVGR
ncbi:MAG: response regulator transcription factor [Clostridia bacterium]|nr:response regulator transcription factor [Clostridia bacterium]